MNTSIPETDRWLIDGDCSKCRRKNYCHTTCKKCKQRMYVVASKTLYEHMYREMSKPKKRGE
jgi:hypothetical protein